MAKGTPSSFMISAQPLDRFDYLHAVETKFRAKEAINKGISSLAKGIASVHDSFVNRQIAQRESEYKLLINKWFNENSATASSDFAQRLEQYNHSILPTILDSLPSKEARGKFSTLVENFYDSKHISSLGISSRAEAQEFLDLTENKISTSAQLIATSKGDEIRTFLEERDSTLQFLKTGFSNKEISQKNYNRSIRRVNELSKVVLDTLLTSNRPEEAQEFLDTNRALLQSTDYLNYTTKITKDIQSISASRKRQTREITKDLVASAEHRAFTPEEINIAIKAYISTYEKDAQAIEEFKIRDELETSMWLHSMKGNLSNLNEIELSNFISEIVSQNMKGDLTKRSFQRRLGFLTEQYELLKKDKVSYLEKNNLILSARNNLSEEGARLARVAVASGITDMYDDKKFWKQVSALEHGVYEEIFQAQLRMGYSEDQIQLMKEQDVVNWTSQYRMVNVTDKEKLVHMVAMAAKDKAGIVFKQLLDGQGNSDQKASMSFLIDSTELIENEEGVFPHLSSVQKAIIAVANAPVAVTDKAHFEEVKNELKTNEDFIKFSEALKKEYGSGASEVENGYFNLISKWATSLRNTKGSVSDSIDQAIKDTIKHNYLIIEQEDGSAMFIKSRSKDSNGNLKFRKKEDGLDLKKIFKELNITKDVVSPLDTLIEMGGTYKTEYGKHDQITEAVDENIENRLKVAKWDTKEKNGKEYAVLEYTDSQSGQFNPVHTKNSVPIMIEIDKLLDISNEAEALSHIQTSLVFVDRATVPSTNTLKPIKIGEKRYSKSEYINMRVMQELGMEYISPSKRLRSKIKETVGEFTDSVIQGMLSGASF